MMLVPARLRPSCSAFGKASGRPAVHPVAITSSTCTRRGGDCSWPRRRPRLVAAAADVGDGAPATPTQMQPQAQTQPQTTADAALFVRTLAEGQTLRHDAGSVVVLGDVPRGCKVEAPSGDVVVLGRVDGDVRGATARPDAMVVACLGFGPSATVALGDALWSAGSGGPREQQQQMQMQGRVMAVLEAGAPGARIVLRPLPGGIPGIPGGEAAGAGGGEGGGGGAVAKAFASQLAPAAALALGVALAAAPSAVLGGLVGAGGAEGVVGALLETAVFGYVLLKGAGLLSEGSELLLEIVDPGIIGGVLLPCLGALPDALIVLSAGLKAATAEAAQEQLAVGMGTLAGSTVLLLSLGWGLSVILGRCDISAATGRAVDKRLTRGFDLNKTGVTAEDDVRKGALIMAASSLLFGLVQVPAFLGAATDPQAAMAGAVACGVAAAAYLAFSVLSPELQRRKIAAARKRRLRLFVVRALAQRTLEAPRLGAIVDPSGRANRATLRALFDEADADRSGTIDADEARALLLGLNAGASGDADRESVDAWFSEMDFDGSRQVTFDEWATALERAVAEKLESAAGQMGAEGGGAVGVTPRAGALTRLLDPRRGGATAALLAELPPDDIAQLRETAAAVEAEPADEAAEDIVGGEGGGGGGEGGEGGGGGGGVALTRPQILVRAGAMLAGGVALCAVFSDPLVESLSNLSKASGVPPFVVAFVLTPLASNSSEFLSSLRFAARKRASSLSLTLSQIYGAVTINNTVVLGLFLYIVSVRGLNWVWTSETCVIVASSVLMGLLGYSRSTFATKWALPAIALYPMALLAVQVLDTTFGWQ